MRPLSALSEQMDSSFRFLTTRHWIFPAFMSSLCNSNYVDFQNLFSHVANLNLWSFEGFSPTGKECRERLAQWESHIRWTAISGGDDGRDLIDRWSSITSFAALHYPVISVSFLRCSMLSIHYCQFIYKRNQMLTSSYEDVFSIFFIWLFPLATLLSMCTQNRLVGDQLSKQKWDIRLNVFVLIALTTT